MIKSTVSERWTSSTSNGCAAVVFFWEPLVGKNGKCEPSREKYPKSSQSSTHALRCSILRSTAYKMSKCRLRFIKLEVLKASPLVKSTPTVLVHKHAQTSLKHALKHSSIQQQGQTSMSRRCWKSWRTCETSWTIGVWDRRGFGCTCSDSI